MTKCPSVALNYKVEVREKSSKKWLHFEWYTSEEECKKTVSAIHRNYPTIEARYSQAG